MLTTLQPVCGHAGKSCLKNLGFAHTNEISCKDNSKLQEFLAGWESLMSKLLQIIVLQTYSTFLHSLLLVVFDLFIIIPSQVQAHEDDVDAVTFADASSQILISGADDGLCKVQDKILFTILVVMNSDYYIVITAHHTISTWQSFFISFYMFNFLSSS